MFTTEIKLIPVTLLNKSTRNVRNILSGSIEALAASIKANGLLQNLVVSKAGNGRFDVEAGGRRLEAIQMLIEREELRAEHVIPCLEIETGNAVQASMAENFIREAMHPYDEFMAFRSLHDEGKTIDAIADAFSVTVSVIERRLKLLTAAPALLLLYKAQEISTEQLVALCATDSHELQCAVWENSNRFNRNPESLRRQVTESDVCSTDRRVTFIGGVDAYISAGGKVRADLFSDENSHFLENPQLLDRLVRERLNLFAADVQKEGWLWVDVMAKHDYEVMNRFGTVKASYAKLTKEQQALTDKLNANIVVLNDEINTLVASDDVDSVEKRLEAIDEEIETLEDEIESMKVVAYNTEQKAYAGAMVVFVNGKVEINRGLVRPEDRKGLQAAQHAAISGGRESLTAGPKVDSESEALKQSLYALRNVAVQKELIAHPHVAKVLLITQLLSSIDGEYSEVPLDLSVRSGYGARTTRLGDEDAAQAERGNLCAFIKQAIRKIPTDATKRWKYLIEQPAKALDELLALLISGLVSLQNEHASFTGLLVDEIKFDMREHFKPTASNYFNRVGKSVTLAVLDKAGVSTEREILAGMKKGDLASEAEKRMSQFNWVPDLVATPKRLDKAAAAKAKPRAMKAAAKPTASLRKPATKKNTRSVKLA
jgi:ParB family transcriptional regulator, chromosome partitioning protein